jgi:hypothetical protein
MMPVGDMLLNEGVSPEAQIGILCMAGAVQNNVGTFCGAFE